MDPGTHSRRARLAGMTERGDVNGYLKASVRNSWTSPDTRRR